MDSIVLRAALAGVMFGMWPLFLNRSGLTGNIATFFFLLITIACVVPFALKSTIIGPHPVHVIWMMVLYAGLASAAGVLIFNSVMMHVAPQDTARPFVIMIIAQICVAAIYDSALSSSLSATKAAGFAFAGIAAVLLTRPS